MPPLLVVRADAGPTMGTGHVMRSLALAQEWKARGGEAVFLISVPPKPLGDRLEAEGVEVRRSTFEPGREDDARGTAELCRERGARVLVMDGYHFDHRFQSLASAPGTRRILVDDGIHKPPISADWLLNANLHARPEAYPGLSGDVRLLLGPTYALIRAEFRNRRDEPRSLPARARRILVTLGGGDVLPALKDVVRAMDAVSKGRDLEVVVVVGTAGGAMSELDSLRKGASFPFRVERNVSDMAPLMAWAETAICAAGSTTWESAFLGLPSILLVLADNQAPIAASMHVAKAAISAGELDEGGAARLAESLAGLLDSKDMRQKLSRAGQAMVDGQGPRRILDAVEGMA